MTKSAPQTNMRHGMINRDLRHFLRVIQVVEKTGLHFWDFSCCKVALRQASNKKLFQKTLRLKFLKIQKDLNLKTVKEVIFFYIIKTYLLFHFHFHSRPCVMAHPSLFETGSEPCRHSLLEKLLIHVSQFNIYILIFSHLTLQCNALGVCWDFGRVSWF